MEDMAQAPQRTARGRRWIFAATGGVLLFALLAIAIVIPNMLRSRRVANEFSAPRALRTINTNARSYSQTYGNGFPPSLAALGPPPAGIAPNCNAADLIDRHLASGQMRMYVIVYTPGPPVEKLGAGCTVPGGKSYTITTRPLEFHRTGTRSFFTDETGVIRFTVDDRPATAQDPPL